MIRTPLFAALFAVFVLALIAPSAAVAQDAPAEASEAAATAADAAAEAGEEESILLPEELLERYIGVYELQPGFEIEVTRDGQQLFGQATGQPPFEMFAESETMFFLKVVDAQIEFDGEGEGPAESMTLYQAGQEIVGLRIE